MIFSVPAACDGAVASSSLSETSSNDEAGTVPNRIFVVGVNPVPYNRTVTPPAVVPPTVSRPLITGSPDTLGVAGIPAEPPMAVVKKL